jgi:hypothetical protein
MSTVIKLSSIFNDATYSDLTVKIDNKKWYCHKCILFTSSDKLRILSRRDPSDLTRDTILFSACKYPAEAIELMLRTMYDHNVSELPYGDQPLRLCIRVYTTASDFDLHALEQHAYSHLHHRLVTQRSENGAELSALIILMRQARSPRLFELADKVEITRMHHLLVNYKAWKYLTGTAIKKWLETYKIEERVNDPEFN